MGLVRSVISAVDRPGGRWALSLASSIVTNLYGDPLAVRYAHGHWYCTSNGMTLPWGPKFNLYDYDLRTLPSRIRHYLKETQDCWFYRYSPKAGDVIVDVGAEMGTDAVTFSRRVGSSGRVICHSGAARHL